MKNEVKPQTRIPQSQTVSLSRWLDTQKAKICASLPPNTVSAERFMTSIKLAIADPKNKTLAACNPTSIIACAIQSASLGLEVGGLLGQAFLIPYKNKDGSYTCTFQTGYKGLLLLARRSNTIKTIIAECVRENDTFTYSPTSDKVIQHNIRAFGNRGGVLGYYCLVKLSNGGEQCSVMGIADIQEYRQRFSKAGSGGAWDTNFDAMAKKTVIIQTLKYCPISVEALQAVRQEEMRMAGLNPEYNVSEAMKKNDTKTERNITEEAVDTSVINTNIDNNIAEGSPTEDVDMEGAEKAFDEAMQNDLLQKPKNISSKDTGEQYIY